MGRTGTPKQNRLSRLVRPPLVFNCAFSTKILKSPALGGGTRDLGEVFPWALTTPEKLEIKFGLSGRSTSCDLVGCV